MIRLLMRRGYRLAGFALHYLRLLVRANIVVAREVMSPRSRLAPGIVVLPLRSRTWVEIATITNLISLTPGTLIVGVRRDPPSLVVHGMHAADAGRFRAELRDLESRMLAAVDRLETDGGARTRGTRGGRS